MQTVLCGDAIGDILEQSTGCRTRRLERQLRGHILVHNEENRQLRHVDPIFCLHLDS